ncbi:MAG: GAF domain-containing protein [Thermoflexales bacterium]|nr:GAF domain-containing protein [Thermoflexales bacterium]
MSTPAIRFLQEESARLQKENKLQQEQIHTLHRYIDALVELYWTGLHLPDRDHLLTIDGCLHTIRRTIGAADGSVTYLDPSTGELVFITVHGELGQHLIGLRIKSDVGIVGWALSNNEPVIVNNPRQDWRFFDQIDQEFSFLTRSIMCVPVAHHSKPIGAIELLNKEGNQEFTEVDVKLVSVLAHLTAVILSKLEDAGTREWIPAKAAPRPTSLSPQDLEALL